METITITLPKETYRQLKERARQSGKHLTQELLELLEKSLRKNADEASSETGAPMRDILISSGRVAGLSPYLQKKIIPGVKLKDVRNSFQRAGGQSLSEIIIEQRGPKIFPYSECD